jgi:Spy/CpxP family protein refolding chaperone
MKKIFTLACALLFALLITQHLSYAKPAKHKEHKENQRFCQERCPKGPFIFGDLIKLQKEIGLSDDQVKKIGDINTNFEKRMLTIKEKLVPMRIQLQKLLIEDVIEMDKVKNLLREISDIRIDIHITRIEHRIEIEKVLTPEQKAKIKTHRHRMHDKFFRRDRVQSKCDM